MSGLPEQFLQDAAKREVGEKPDQFARRLERNFSDIDSKLEAPVPHSKLATATAGQLLIANASGVVTATTMGGDATISPSGTVILANNSVGATQIETGAVGSSELAAEAVTSPKMAPGALTGVEVTGGTDNFDSSFATLSSMSLAVGAGTYMVWAKTDVLTTGPDTVELRILIGGSQQGFTSFTPPSGGTEEPVSIQALGVASGSSTISFQGRYVDSSGPGYQNGYLMYLKL